MIIRNRSVWPTLFLLNVFTALKGTHFYILIPYRNLRIDRFSHRSVSFFDLLFQGAPKVTRDNSVIIVIYISEFISLEGSLDLLETWDDDLYNQNSSLYIQTTNNFTKEVSGDAICLHTFIKSLKKNLA